MYLSNPHSFSCLQTASQQLACRIGSLLLPNFDSLEHDNMLLGVALGIAPLE